MSSCNAYGCRISERHHMSAVSGTARDTCPSYYLQDPIALSKPNPLTRHITTPTNQPILFKIVHGQEQCIGTAKICSACRQDLPDEVNPMWTHSPRITQLCSLRYPEETSARLAYRDLCLRVPAVAMQFLRVTGKKK